MFSPDTATLRKLGLTTAALAGLAFVGLFFFGPQGLPAFQRKWSNVQASEKANADLRKEIEEMKARNHRLRTDQEEIKVAIREELGKQGKGEVTLKLGDRPKK